jgi:hypothetical protein
MSTKYGSHQHLFIEHSFLKPLSPFPFFDDFPVAIDFGKLELLSASTPPTDREGAWFG